LFYNDSNNTAQINFSTRRAREISIGLTTNGTTGFYKTDPIPYGTTAQRSASQYRGACNVWPWVEDNAFAFNDQAYGRYIKAGSNSSSDFGDFYGTRTVFGSIATGTNTTSMLANSTSGANAAINLVVYIGYLEPGDYKLWNSYSTYNAGTSYVIVRGYTGEDLTGTSSNYLYIQRSESWAGGWREFGRATGGADFTVNSTYPYCILDMECHNASTANYLIISANRKGSTNVVGQSAYLSNPNIERV
jgi:hypothetical protein